MGLFDVSGISATNAAARVSWGRDADENCKVIAAMTRAHHHDDDARYDRWKGWHNLSIVYLNEETPHPRDYSMSTIVSCGFATLLVVYSLATALFVWLHIQYVSKMFFFWVGYRVP